MQILDFFKNISPAELTVILVILFVLFGSKVLIGLGKTGGETVRELKRVKKSFTDALNDDDDSGTKQKGA